MTEKEFIDLFGRNAELKRLNIPCCESIVKKIKNESNDIINQLIKLKLNEKIKWFINIVKNSHINILAI